MKDKKMGGLKLIIPGVLGSLVFIIIGYFLAAASGVAQETGSNYTDALNIVLADPFTLRFNDYSPVYMLLAAVIFESCFAVYLMFGKKETEFKTEDYKPDIIDLVDLNEDEFNKKKEPVADEDLFSKFIKKTGESSSEEKKERPYVKANSGKDTRDVELDSSQAVSEEEEKLSFGSEIMDEMLGDHYEVDQLLAMLKIKKYIKDVDADLLKRMFRVDMTPEEIDSYITLFYE